MASLGNASKTKSATDTSMDQVVTPKKGVPSKSKKAEVKRNNDFTFKIVQVNGKKTRVQLWD